MVNGRIHPMSKMILTRAVPYVLALILLIAILSPIGSPPPVYKQVPQTLVGSVDEASNSTMLLESNQFTVDLSNLGSDAPGFVLSSHPNTLLEILTNLTITGDPSVPIQVDIYNESNGKLNATYEGNQIYLTEAIGTQIAFYELLATIVSGQFSVTDYNLNSLLAANVSFTNYQHIPNYVFNISTGGFLESKLSLSSTADSGSSYVAIYLDHNITTMLTVYGNLPPKSLNVAGKEVIFSDYSEIGLSIFGSGLQEYSMPLSEISKVSLNSVGSSNVSIRGESSSFTATSSNGNYHRESGQDSVPYLISSETSIVITLSPNSAKGLGYDFVSNYSELFVEGKPQLKSLINTPESPFRDYLWLLAGAITGWLVTVSFGYIRHYTSVKSQK